jgi:hypothetical protein
MMAEKGFGWRHGEWRAWASFFLLAGLGAMSLGVADATMGNGLQARLVGGAFAFGGGAMVGASICLFRDTLLRTWAPSAVLWAGIIGISLNAYLFLAQQGHIGGYRTVLWLTWTILGLLFLLAVFRRPRPEATVTTTTESDDAHRTRTTVSRLSSLGVSAASVGLALSATQFWYTAGYAPGKLVAYELSVAAGLKDEGITAADGTMHAFLATVGIKNPGANEVQIVRSTYTVEGATVTGMPPDTDLTRRFRPPDEGTSSRHTIYGATEMIEAGRLVDDGSYVEPGQELTSSFAIALPQKAVVSYSDLHLSARFIVSKGDRLRTTSVLLQSMPRPCTWDKQDYDQCTVTEMAIAAPSWFWRLTKGSQTLDIIESLSFKTTADPRHVLDACVDRLERPRQDPSNPQWCDGLVEEDLTQYYGLGRIETSSDLPLVASSPSNPPSAR